MPRNLTPASLAAALAASVSNGRTNKKASNPAGSFNHLVGAL
jgi:hypothetical protein